MSAWLCAKERTYLEEVVCHGLSGRADQFNEEGLVGLLAKIVVATSEPLMIGDLPFLGGICILPLFPQSGTEQDGLGGPISMTYGVWIGSLRVA